MTPLAPVKILLVEDDEDDYLITQSLIEEITNQNEFSEEAVPQFELEWVKTYESALETIGQKRHDVILLDYDLGARSGIDVLRESVKRGHQTPAIIFTDSDSYAIDRAASELGAVNFLDKRQVPSHMLERAIRYAITSTTNYRQEISLLHRELKTIKDSCQKANELQQKLEKLKLNLSQTHEDLQPLEDSILLLRKLYQTCCLSTKGPNGER